MIEERTIVYVVAFNNGGRPDIIEDVALDEETAYRLAFEVAEMFGDGAPLYEWECNVDTGHRIVPEKITTWRRGDDTVRIIALKAEGEACS